MMRKLPVWLALSLLAAAGPAAPQAPNPGSSEERAAAPDNRLKLRLDDAARYTGETPRADGGRAGALPSLGANARPMPITPTPTPTQSFPKDTERKER